MPTKKASPKKAGGSKESGELNRAKAKLQKIQKLASAILKLTGKPGTGTVPPTTGD